MIHPDHSHHYCPGSTMSLNRRHLCKHAGSQQGSTNGAGGGEDEGGVSGGGWGDFEDEESEDLDIKGKTRGIGRVSYFLAI